MPLPPELLADDPASTPAATAAAVYGRGPALALGTSLLLALALVTLLRWVGDSASTLEEVVPQPVAADAMTSAPKVDLTAPDPGDSPP